MRILLIILFCISGAQAATCFVVDDDGTQWFKNLPSRSGSYPKTLGYVSSSKPCPKDITYALPEVTEPTYDFTGLSRVYLNPKFNGDLQCKFVKIDINNKLTDGKYLVNLELYDASQQINGVASCPY